MGLFGKKEAKKEVKKDTNKKTVEETKKKVYTQWDSVWINLTEKMIRVELEGDKAFAGYTYIKENGDRIRLVGNGGIIYAEIGKRGKAYKELEPHIGLGADEIEIESKTGEYGDYYRVRLKFKSTVIIYDD